MLLVGLAGLEADVAEDGSLKDTKSRSKPDTLSVHWEVVVVVMSEVFCLLLGEVERVPGFGESSMLYRVGETRSSGSSWSLIHPSIQ